ncbi:YdeI/OmpD-associated family protein [Amycolatopsis sp. QT-25]|uniref:YdeI/OmpD-associated family protein n=1 Tax=Amycolatopsis sp. QT-25 TaxID=3034022 RepID=UPI0023EC0458|nr:YdeI/OmpD-associated family protein [Amycolatopsis sp. QT-25]WET80850.1 YdeI/OmpD-associated family protein [Amycolatopsis sp. QT-25]
MNETIISAADPAEWRAWLAENAATGKEVWLIIRHRGSGVPGVRIEEAMEQALCFGWIDGLHRKHDATSSRLRFTPRGPRISWSRVNRERAARLIAEGRMTERGQAMIDLAKTEGRWQVVPDGDGVPEDLRTRLEADEAARTHFARFPPSSRRLILEWILTAKKPETRERRIARTVELAAVNLRANHPVR